jgi:tetratricopeptide (TPR) repeat protein
VIESQSSTLIMGMPPRVTPVSCNETMGIPESEREGTDVTRRYACVLNNIGGLLFQRGSCTQAMAIFQECVQMMMQAEDGDAQAAEVKVALWKKHDTMDYHLQQLRQNPSMKSLPTEDDSPKKRPASSFAAQAQEGSVDPRPENLRTKPPAAVSPVGPSSYTQEYPRETGIPGLFQCTAKLPAAGQTRAISPGTDAPPLAFPDPFYVALNDPDQPRQRPFTLRIGFDQCSEGTLFNMGLIHYSLGSIDSAVQFFELSMSLAPTLAANSPIPLNPVILACLNNLGRILCHRGRSIEAKGLISDALARGSAGLTHFYTQNDTKMPSPESVEDTPLFVKETGLHRFLARTLMNMGEVHFCVCDFDGAMTSCKDARRLLHPNISDVDASALLYNMAIIHQHRQERQSALTHYESFLRIANNLVGPNHTQVATALHSIGVIYHEMGKLHEALRPLLRSLTIRQMKSCPSHQCIAESLHWVGKVLHDREEYSDAKGAYEKALAIQRAACGEEASLEVAQLQMDMGRILHSQDLFVESLAAYGEVLTIARRAFGDRHLYVARILNIVGNLHVEQGELSEAMDVFSQSMRIHHVAGIPVDMHVVKNRLYRVVLSRHSHGACA